MSNIDQMTSSDLLEITSANQALFTNLNAEDAETISGGAEVFTIKNSTNLDVFYTIDGGVLQKLGPNGAVARTANNGGIIRFDADVRNNYQQYKSYNLAHNRVYAFENNNNTPGNPFDYDLYTKA